MKRHVRKIMFGFFAGLLLIGCNEGSDVPNELDQWQKDVQAIDSYLTTQGISAIKDASGVRIAIATLGNGLPAKIGNGVDVDYVGRRFEDKSTFEQGNARNSLTSLIEGWQAALIKLPAGSEATIYIPSLLAYGASGKGTSIAPNAILEFDIIFNEVVLSTAEIQRLKTDTAAVALYLSDKGITAVEDPTGLRYVITQMGTGPIPTWYDQVEFNAVYKLLSDDSNTVATISLAPSASNLNRVIDQVPHGFKTALQKLPVGSKATLYIPSGLAYGAEGASNGSVQVIPANANIIVDIELLDIVNQ